MQSPSETDRLAALNQLAARDPAAAVQLLAQALPHLESWPLLRRACELAVQFDNPILIDPLIQSLARPATSYIRTERPEALALQQLTHQPLPPLLQSRLLSATKTPPRVAALDLLSELQSPARVQQFLLASSPVPADDLLLALQWWAQTFATLPAGLQESSWVQQLHHSATQPWLLRAIARHQQLRAEPDYHIAPRFIALLANVDDTHLALSRPELLADIQSQISSRPTAHRQPSYPAPDDYHPTLAAQEKNLSRCDLFAIELLLTSLHSPAFVRELQSLGNADRLDPTTEHGGLLEFVVPTPPSASSIVVPTPPSALHTAISPSKATLITAPLHPKIYPPLYTGRDTVYLTSDALLADTPLALAQFHFHFQQTNNEPNAGPGRGDLDYIHQIPCTCIVFTSITPTTFNATYYTPTGAILDLGNWPNL